MKRLSALTILAVLIASPLAFAQVGEFDSEASLGTDQGAGVASFSGGTYTIEASGADIWGTADGMYWVYKPISGSFRATVDLEWGIQAIPAGDFADGNDWKKMGIMLRNEGENASAAYMFAMLREDLGSTLQSRPATGESAIGTTLIAKAANETDTVQLLRLGSTFSMLRKRTDGSWRTIGTYQNNTFPDNAFIGLAVTSHDTANVETGIFKNFSIETVSVAATSTRLVTGAAVSKPGDTVQVEVRVSGLAGDSDTTTVTEVVPVGWTIGAMNASAGNASANGNVITWKITGSLSSKPILTYSVTVGSNLGTQAFSGSAAVGNSNLPTGGESGLFVGVKSADLGLFDDSMDIFNTDATLGAEGVAFYDAGSGLYTVVGSGHDIWDANDDFHFLYKAVPIDQFVSLKAHVELDGFTSSSTWAKAGPMIRDDLEANSSHVFSMIREQGRDFAPQWRDTWGAGGGWDGDPTLIFGGTEEGQQSGTVAISRDPATDTVTYSYWDAATGEKVDSLVREASTEFLGSFDDSSIYYIGFAVTSHEAGSLSIGRFSSVQLTIGDQTSDVGAWSLY